MALEVLPEDEAEYKAFCASLRELRQKKGMSQSEVAGLMGVAQANYNRLENGEGFPKITTLKVWARALGYKLEMDLVMDVESFDTSFDEALEFLRG